MMPVSIEYFSYIIHKNEIESIEDIDNFLECFYVVEDDEPNDNEYEEISKDVLIEVFKEQQDIGE